MTGHIQVMTGIDTFCVPHNGPETGPVALGGILSTNLLLDAYSKGIFPWFDSDHSPIYWWSPSPRAILYPHRFHVSKSLYKWLKKQHYLITVDRNFSSVICACAEPRSYSMDTWITPKMIRAYEQLHTLGYAHSLEVWRKEVLVGGIYGLALGRHFYGESMFSKETNVSKLAMFVLCQILEQENYQLLDCQLVTSHLVSLGVLPTLRSEFLSFIEENRKLQEHPATWKRSDVWDRYRRARMVYP